MRNESGLGREQRRAYEFIQQVNGWHTFAPDVRRVVLSLEKRGLVLVSHATQQFAFNAPIHCDQCEMLSINGHACHETGCPNSRKTWCAERGEWLRVTECRECGAEYFDCDTHECFVD